MDLKPVDLADDALLAGAYAVECEATRHARPGWVPLGAQARILSWRADDGWRLSMVGAFEGERLLGIATAMTARDTPDTTWVGVSVDPGHQRHGIGSELVRAAEATLPPGPRRYVAGAYRPTAAEMERLVLGFAQPLGYTRATTETVVELDLAGAGLPSVQPPVGYSVSTYVGGVPAHLRAQVGVLKGLVDAEAPHGDLGWKPTPVSAQEYVDEIARWLEQGRTAVESVALDRRGAVVAWTCLVMTADPHRPAQVEGTLVLPSHRGRRLGAAVKAACLLTARELGAARVRTSSDDENVWMRAINRQLGFVPVEVEALLHRRHGGPPPTVGGP